MYVNKDFKLFFKRWSGSYRKVYNTLVDASKLEENKGKFANEYNLRDVIVTKVCKKEVNFGNSFIIEPPNFEEGIYDTPKNIRQCAVKEFVTAWNKSKMTDETMKFKEKKSKIQTIALEKVSLQGVKEEKEKTYFTLFKNLTHNCQIYVKGARNQRRLNEWDENRTDFSITFDGFDFWLNLPIKCKNKTSVKDKHVKITGIDPGKRSLVTCYNSSKAYSYETNEAKIFKDLHKMDKLKGDKKLKLSRKITQRINSYHILIAKELVKYNTHVVLGKLDTQELTKHGGENKKNFNRIFTLQAHYKLRNRIELECLKNDVNFILVKEHYTSKTCGSCGEINHELGDSKIFSCPSCNVVMDRDVNAARNMIAKLLLWGP